MKLIWALPSLEKSVAAALNGRRWLLLCQRIRWEDRSWMIPNITTRTLQNVVDQYVQKGATIECDGYRSYPRLENVTVDAPSNR